MKQGTIALVSAGILAAGILLAGTRALIAQPLPPGPVHYDTRAYYYGGRVAPPYVYAPEDEAMPPYEVAAIMRSRGFLPLGGPVRRGGFYVIAAAHPGGGDGRLVIDAYSGRIVRFVPAQEVIRPSRNDEMELVYQGPTFPPPDGVRTAARFGAPPVPERGAPRPPASVPRVASRVPYETPLVTPKPRPQAAPQRPDTAQARPPVPAPVETKPAAPSPPLAQKPVEKTPDRPVVQPTQPLPPVQTME